MSQRSSKQSASQKRTVPSKASSKASKTSKLTVDEGVSAPPAKKLKTLNTLLKPPLFELSSQEVQKRDVTAVDVKGKKPVKEKVHIAAAGLLDDRLWVDVYEPTTENELAVHKKKVDDVCQWLLEAFDGGPSGTLSKYRRILALTGPAGTAKTATIRVLSRELGFEILEWRNTVGEGFSKSLLDHQNGVEYEGPMNKFEVFLARASSCGNIFAADPSFSTSSSQTSAGKLRRQVVLLEDLPNILHPQTQERFHAVLHSFLSSAAPGIPIVILISDAGTRGEASDERLDQGGGSGHWTKDVVDVRSVLPTSLLRGPFVTQIAFNPIAPTLMRRALQSLLSMHFSKSPTERRPMPSKDVLDVIVNSSNGDIRSAIMALQFACVAESPGGKKGKRKNGGVGTTVVLEAITRREQSLALFHLLGKVLYNKRKGDPPSASATAKDVQREKELDAKIRDPPPLPAFLQQEDRRGSRVDVDALYADSPIDSGLFSLYIHENYPQFCDDLQHCDGVIDWLSWVDSSGGETWQQANPHRFHLVTLGALHSLPSPVARRSQKFFKPAFFENIHKKQEADDALRDTAFWLSGFASTSSIESCTSNENSSSGRVGAWAGEDIALELGGVLKARRAARSRTGCPSVPPETCRLFSELVFARSGNSTSGHLGEEDDEADVILNTADRRSFSAHQSGAEGAVINGQWLESDDIDDY